MVNGSNGLCWSNVRTASSISGLQFSHYKAAIKFKPDFALAHINLGNALLAIQKTDEAITHYRFAIKINPNHTLAHNNLKIALRQSETK